MRREIALTDDELEARFAALGYGVCEEDLVYTRETIDEYLDARKSYAEPGGIAKHEADCLVLERIQHVRGATRRDVVIIDFGTVRAVFAG